jgi:hypothetical protein
MWLSNRVGSCEPMFCYVTNSPRSPSGQLMGPTARPSFAKISLAPTLLDLDEGLDSDLILSPSC